MSNTIATQLQRDVYAESVLTAFQKALAPLSLFSTAFRDVPLEGTNKIQVAYYPLETAASKDFAGTYVFDTDTDTQSKEVTINKRKYQPFHYTSSEVARQPKFDPEKLGMLKGEKLAEDILVDILSVVTAANYGNVDFALGNYDAADKLTSTFGNFDMDDIVDLETICDEHHWPQAGRGLLLKPAYLGNVKKDLAADGGIATYGINPAGDRINLPRLNSFSVAQSTVIPANAENLVGMAVYPSAIIVGFSPIPPADELNKIVAYQAYTDGSTGITIEYRAWADGDSDMVKQAWEVNYGFGVGEAAAIKRIVSA